MNDHNINSTKSNFGRWGWTMIVYAGLMYFFGSGFRSDGLNVIVGNFAAAHALDGNQLLALATPAIWAATPALMPSWRCWTSSPSSSSRWWTTPASARTEYSLFR